MLNVKGWTISPAGEFNALVIWLPFRNSLIPLPQAQPYSSRLTTLLYSSSPLFSSLSGEKNKHLSSQMQLFEPSPDFGFVAGGMVGGWYCWILDFQRSNPQISNTFSESSSPFSQTKTVSSLRKMLITIVRIINTFFALLLREAQYHSTQCHSPFSEHNLYTRQHAKPSKHTNSLNSLHNLLWGRSWSWE